MKRPSKNQVLRLRIKAIRLHKEGYSNPQIAKKIGVSDTIVRRWVNAFKSGGLQELLKPDMRGGKSKLTNEQNEKLIELLKNGARNYGFPTNGWTINRILELINKEFNVCYTKQNIRHLLLRNGGYIRDSRKEYSALENILKTIQKRPAKDFGYKDNRWTARRVKELVLIIYNIEYTYSQIYKYLNKRGWYFKRQD